MMKIRNILTAFGLVLVLAACGKVEVDTEWQPLPMPEPPRHSFGIDVDFSGDTALFLRNATLYFITQQGADSVALVGDAGDTTALANGVFLADGIAGLHLRTTRSAALFEGRVVMVVRDLPDPPATMGVGVALTRDDTLYFSHSYTVSTADTIRTLHLSSDVEKIKFE